MAAQENLTTIEPVNGPLIGSISVQHVRKSA